MKVRSASLILVLAALPWLLSLPAEAVRVTDHINFLDPPMGMNALVEANLSAGALQRSQLILDETGNLAVIRGARSFTVYDGTLETFMTVETDSPFAMALNEAQRRLYVAYLQEDLVRVFSLSPWMALAEIPVGDAPALVEFNTATGLLYVYNSGSGDLSVVNGGTLDVVSTIPLPGADVVAMAIHKSTNRLLAVRFGDGTTSYLTAIDGYTGAVVEDVPTLGRRTRITVVESLNKIYLGGTTADIVRVSGSDATDQLVLTGLASGVTAMAGNEAAGEVYVCGGSLLDPFADPEDFVVIDGATDTPTLLDIDAGINFDIALDEAGGRVFLAHAPTIGTGRIMVLDAGNNFQLLAAVDPASDPASLVYSPGADRVYAVAPSTGFIVNVDAGNAGYPFTKSAISVSLLNPHIIQSLIPPKLYIQNLGFPGVSSVDASTDLRGVDIKTGTVPFLGLGLESNGMFYEISAGESTVTIIDGATDTAVDTLSGVGALTFGASAIDVDPAKIYMVNILAFGTDDAFQELDTQLPGLTDLGLPLGSLAPSAVAANATTGKIYVSVLNFLQNRHEVAVYDPSSIVSPWVANIAIQEATGNPLGGLLALHEGLNKIYSDDQDGELAVIDGSSDTLAGTSPIALTGIPTAIQVDSARDTVVALVSDTSTVEVIDALTDTVSCTIPLAADPGGMFVDAVDGLIYLTLIDTDELVAYDYTCNSVAVMTNMNAFLGQGGFMEMNAAAPARGYAVDNLHGSVAVVDASVPNDDMQIDDVALPEGTVNVAYSQSLTVTGGTGPYAWSVVSGVLPPGLTLSDPVLGTLDGTPTEAGTWTFMMRCEDSLGYPDLDEVTIAITELTIVTTWLPDGGIGLPYSVTLKAIGGIPPYTWNLAAGLLPDGLTLTDPAAGLIDGIPTTEEIAAFDIEVTDSNPATPATAQRSFTLAVLGPPELDSVNPGVGSAGQVLTVTLNGRKFRPGAAVSFSGGDISVDSVAFVSDLELSADITIDPLAALGLRDVTVTHLDTQSVTAIGAFEVQDLTPPVPVGNTLRVTRTGVVDELRLDWAQNTVDADWKGSNVFGATLKSDLPAGLDAAQLEPFRLGPGSLPNTPDVDAPDAFFLLQSSEALQFFTVRYIDQAGNTSAD